MKKLTFLTTILCLTMLMPAMAGRKSRPFAWHGTATRIAADASLLPKEEQRNHPLWLLEPLRPIAERAESPSGKSSSAPAAGERSFARCLCPWTWFGRRGD